VNKKKVKIKVENLSKIFGNNPAEARKLLKKGLSKEDIYARTRQTVGVFNASFEVYEGETLVIMGLSGSGKSTLLRCLNRLIEPTAGKVVIDDTDVTGLSEKELIDLRRHKFGMVFQNFALFSHRTVLDNVAYGLEVQGLKRKHRKNRALKALKMVGLDQWTDSFPAQLSGGMQQRVGLARAFATDPDVLLMDEAFSALDPLIRNDMQDELMDLESEVKKTIVFITHDLDEALKIGDRIVLMKDGEVIQVGTAEEILTRPANDYVRKFVENVDFTRVLTARDVMRKPHNVAFLRDGPRTALHKIKDLGTSGIFVVDQKHELQGYVTADKALDLIKDEEDKLDKAIIRYKKFAVTPDVQIKDLFKILNDSRYPLAVVDQKRRLMGVIVEGTMIAALAERSEVF